MGTFWISLLIIVLVGHVVWFILYAIRVLKNDNPEFTQPGQEQEEHKDSN